MMKKLTFGCACASALLSWTSSAAGPLGNGARLPSTVQPLLGIASTGGLILPVVGIELPLLSTSQLAPLLAGPLGSSPSLPNRILEPGLAVASPVVFEVLPGLDGAYSQALAPALTPATPVINEAVKNLTGTITAVNGPGPGAPPGSGGGR